MFWNKLKTAFRHIRASKGISLISIIGLAAATISVHILHTARQNPINSIRYE
jgi:hypothetical protein